MKTRTIFLVFALLLLLGMWGCLETGLNDGTDDSGDPSLGDLNTSGCKNDTAREAKHNGNAWNEDDSDVSYNGVIKAKVGNKSVTIMHLDAVYQCEAEIIYMLEASGSNLILTEVDSSEVQTYCICNFDLSVDILNLTNGRTYHAEVWNSDKTVMFGSVDFTPGDCSHYDECKSDEDCWRIMEESGQGWPDCEGNFICVDGTCQWECGNWPTYCHSDSDCPYGYYCAWGIYEENKCWVDQNGNETCEDAPGWGNGVCVPRETWECRSDYDCPEGYFCNYAYYAEGSEGYRDDCWTNSDGSTDCKDEPMPPAYGYCEPRSYECYSDADCPSGYFCNMVAWAQDYDKPEACWTNPDGSTECKDDEPMPPAYGYCELINTYECLNDADCPEGYFCAFYRADYNQDCWVDDAGNSNCPGYPYYGYCVPRAVYECNVADDCYRNPMIACDGAFWTCDNGYCNQRCGDGWYECNSNADCPQGASCEYYIECNDPTIGDCRSGSYCNYENQYCGPNGTICPAGTYCSDGVCIGGLPCNANVDCAANEVCMNGLCQASGSGVPCGENGECAPEEICNWCPPDPNCPMCDVCGQPVCVRR